MGASLKNFANWTVPFSFFGLAVAAGWAIKNVRNVFVFSAGIFSFLLVHGIIGVFGFVHPSRGNLLQEVSIKTTFMARVITLPLMTADFFMMLDFSICWALVLFIIATLPLLAKIQNGGKYHTYALDLAVIINVALIIYIICSLQTGYWLGGLGTLVTLNHFGLRRLSLHYDITCMEITTIGLTFFTIFSLNSLQEIKLISETVSK